MFLKHRIKIFLVVLLVCSCPAQCLATVNIIGRYPSGADICGSSGLIYLAYVDVDEDPSTGAWVGPTWYPNETQVPLYPTNGSMDINPPDELGVIRLSFDANDCNEPGWETRPGKFVLRFVDVMANGYVWNDPSTWQQKQVMNAKFKFSHGDITNYEVYNGPDDPGNILNSDPKIEAIAYESWDMVDEVDRATGNGDHSLNGVKAGFSELVFLTDFKDSKIHYIELSMIPALEPTNPGTEGLVAQYAFESSVEDISGNGHNGILLGDPNYVGGMANYGMALDFDGIDDLVELGKFDVVGQITLAAWIKADDFEIHDARIISKANEWGGNDHWWLLSTISETSLRFRLKTDDGQDTATLVSDPVLEVGMWAHVAATWDGSSMRIYRDGVEVANQEKGGSAVAVDPGISVAVGSQPSDAFASDPARVVKFFDGLVDEVVIYSRALSEGELLYLAGERAMPVDLGTDTLVAYYPLDNDANDVSGNYLDGMLLGGDLDDPNDRPQFVVGQASYDMALDFDGVDDYVLVADSNAFDAMSKAFTISAWIKPRAESLSDRRPIMSKELEPNPEGRGWEFKVNNGQLAMQLYSPVEGEGKLTITGNTTLIADHWVHIVGIFQADGPEQFYINGQLDQEQELVTALQVNDSPAHIGAYIWSWSGYRKYFAGQIDDLRIYSRTLSETEIGSLAGAK